MTRRINAQAQAITMIATELRRRLPAALAHAAAITPDGYSRGTTGSGRAPGVPDPVGNAVAARTGIGTPAAVADLTRILADVAVLLGDALTIVDSLAPAPGASPRCSGGAGLDGHLEWGDPACRNVPDGRPSRQGMCDSCYLRAYRWQTRVPSTAA